MQAVKKLEIIADSLEMNRILGMLDEIGVSGYTVIREVFGKGDSGRREGDQLVDVLKNAYVMIACSEQQALQIVERIRPVLKEFGGVCLLSDAAWVVH